VIIQRNFAPSSVPKSVDVADLVSRITKSLTGLLESHELNADAHASLRVHLDWIQYKTNFREPVMVRRALDRDGALRPLTEISIDLRQIDPARVDEQLAVAAAHLEAGPVDPPGRFYVDTFKPWRDSLIWPFNRLFWRKLDMWEKHANRGYEAALPSGGSDSTNPDAITWTTAGASAAATGT